MKKLFKKKYSRYLYTFIFFLIFKRKCQKFLSVVAVFKDTVGNLDTFDSDWTSDSGGGGNSKKKRIGKKHYTYNLLTLIISHVDIIILHVDIIS